MKTNLHSADSRGHANHGWLDTHHTFSFANYYNPERIRFGLLRVLNDDIVEGGKGFGTHPHENMEIISIPLEGDLEHKDSMGTTSVIRENDVQVMSAGTGVYHSEYNKNADRKVNFLQLWIFPKERDIAPRYDQKSFAPDDRKNKLQEIVSPLSSQNESSIKVNQEAWLFRSSLSRGQTLKYKVNRSGNGTYVFLIDGHVTLGKNELKRRDGIGIWETTEFDVEAREDAEILFIEVPMN